MSNNIQTLVTSEGRTIAFRVDEDGNKHRLNPAEEKAFLEAKAYKASLVKKVGQGAALAGGIAAGELAIGGLAVAGETALAVTEAIALAPILAIGGTIAAIGFGAKWLIDQAEEPTVDENGTTTVKVGDVSFKVPGTSAN